MKSGGGRALWLDAAERLVILALYGWLFARVVGSILEGRSVANLLLLASEGLVLVFILLRRRADHISERPLDWVIAFAATSIPLLVSVSDRPSPIPLAVGATVLVMGTLIQLHAKVCLGRSFGCVPAHRGLAASGPYKFVRHPMYAGYLLGDVGFLALNPTWHNAAIYAVCTPLQIWRLLAEERLLARDDAYRAYQVAVPWRLLPGVF